MNQTAFATEKQKASRASSKVFQIGCIAPIEPQWENFSRAISAASELGFRVLMLAEGDSAAQKSALELSEKYPQIQMLESSDAGRKKILETSDVIFFPAPPDPERLRDCIRARAVPILPEGSGIENFDAQKESGTGFVFESGNFWHLFAAFVRAAENWKFSYDWKNLQKNLSEVEI